jgi:uncharacterized protein HemY
MKTLIAIAILTATMTTTAQAATYYGNSRYERSIRIACENQNTYRDRKSKHLNKQAAKECFYNTVDMDRRNAYLDSATELNREVTKQLRRSHRTINRR